MQEIDHKRRQTLQNLTLLSGGVLLAPTLTNIANGQERNWAKIRKAYLPQTEMINLNNAGVSPAPVPVQEKMIAAYRFSNELPDVHMWEELDTAMPRIKEKLAVLADCDPKEIAINRNTTEGLCTAIYGMPLKAGDEILLCHLDYASMIEAWKLRSKRDGLSVKWVSFDMMDDDEVIIDAYLKTISPKTKVIHLTHMLHWNGRVLPVKKLCKIAKDRGIKTVVDAAQSFAQIPVSFRDLDCDYFATSLHKWLCAPFGTGMLIMRSSVIDETYPLLAPYDPGAEGIARFDLWSLGTYNSAAETAIETAIDFHNSVGPAAKHQRLSELSQYWVEKVQDINGFKIHTPMDSSDLGAVTLFSIEGMDIAVIEKRLIEEHKIRTRWRKTDGVAGVRVSPHIYTSESDLDKFADALRKITKT